LQAVQALQAASRFELTHTGLWAPYLRGLAHLSQRAGAEAATEFRKILERKGALFTSSINSSAILYPLAQLGLARAPAIAGDTASRKAYQEFFALWTDADPEIVILQDARREYEKLK